MKEAPSHPVRPPAPAACPACAGSEIVSHYRRNRPDRPWIFSPTASDFGIFSDLLRCRACGAVFSSAVPRFADLRGIYESGRHEDYRVEEANRRRTFRGLIRSLQPCLAPRPPGSLLDVGASTGLFLDTFDGLYPGWSLRGVEASRWAVEECRRLFGRELIQGMFETVSIPPSSQDAVTMLDLIEHLPDPLRTLRAARRCLKPDGLLVLTTPNLRSVPSRLLGPRWWGYRLTHVLYLGPASLGRLLRRAGFRMVGRRPLIKYFNLGYCLGLIGRGKGWPLNRFSFPLPLGDMLVLAKKEEER